MNRYRLLFILPVLALALVACQLIPTPTPPRATVTPTLAPPSSTVTPTPSVPQPTPTTGSTPSQGSHTLFVEPDDGVAPVLDAIVSASTSLEMKMYLLSDRQIIDALKAAQARGVKVRVLLEENPYGGGSGNKSVYNELQAAGVAVQWTNPVFRLTHEKSLVVDDGAALIMTCNMTHSAFISNREYGIITHQPAEVKEVLDGFNADWDRRLFTPNPNSALVWSNVNSRLKVLAFIDSAQQTLVLEQEEMQDAEVQQHLINAARRGVKVRVLVAAPQSGQTDPNRPGELQISAGGVAVRIISTPYMHAKVYLADGNRALTGSMNVSTSSLDNNRELGIIVSDPEIASRIVGTFEKDWVRGVDLK
jgi:cardiolipin synthase